jgi:hypothetical protein
MVSEILTALADEEILRAIASEHLALAAAHHLAVGVIATIFWTRRRAMERPVALYFALAFGTTAFVLWSRPSMRVAAGAAAVLALLWLPGVVRPRFPFDMRETPRLRLMLMAAAGLFAFAYPGSSGDLPSFIFSPIGVTLAPTLVLAIAFLNAVSPAVDRALHWALAATGVALAAAGLSRGLFAHLPLAGVSVYAVALLLGKGRTAARPDDASGRSVREIRDRMYARRTLLPGPREPRRRRLNIRKRKR